MAVLYRTLPGRGEPDQVLGAKILFNGGDGHRNFLRLIAEVEFAAGEIGNGIEKIDGAACYKLVANDPKFGHVTLWIDSNYFLLRQMTWEHSEARLAQSTKKADEGLKKMGQQRLVPPITSKIDFLKFEIYQVDSRVDEKLFEDPTQK